MPTITDSVVQLGDDPAKLHSALWALIDQTFLSITRVPLTDAQKFDLIGTSTPDNDFIKKLIALLQSINDVYSHGGEVKGVGSPVEVSFQNQCEHNIASCQFTAYLRTYLDNLLKPSVNAFNPLPLVAGGAVMAILLASIFVMWRYKIAATAQELAEAQAAAAAEPDIEKGLEPEPAAAAQPTAASTVFQQQGDIRL